MQKCDKSSIIRLDIGLEEKIKHDKISFIDIISRR